MSALTELFTSLSNKIRNKLGTSNTYTPTQAISAIDNVYNKGVTDTKVGNASTSDVKSGKTFTNSSGVGLEGTFAAQEKTVTAGTSASSVTPDSGKYLTKVTYNPTPSQTKSASPSTSAQTISPDSGKLLSSVSISAISPVKSNTGEAALGSGVDSTGPYVYIPYGYYAARTNYNPYIRMTASQASNAHKHTDTWTPGSSYYNSSAAPMGEYHNYRYVNTSVCYNAAKSNNKQLLYSDDGRQGSFSYTVDLTGACVLITSKNTTVTVSNYESNTYSTSGSNHFNTYMFRSIGGSTKISFTNPSGCALQMYIVY